MKKNISVCFSLNHQVYEQFKKLVDFGGQKRSFVVDQMIKDYVEKRKDVIDKIYDLHFENESPTI